MASKNVDIQLKNVRLSFAHLFDVKANRNRETNEIQSYSYEAVFLLDKEKQKELIEQVRLASRDVIAAMWPSDAPVIPADRRCLQDGEVLNPDTGEKKAKYEGYAGMVTVTARRSKSIPAQDRGKAHPDTSVFYPDPPQLLGPQRGPDGKFPRVKKGDGLLYSGCYVDAIVRIYCYNGAKDGNPHRVNASLEAVKFRAHGEAFGKGAPIDADSMFEDSEVDDGFNTEAAKPKAADDDLL